MRSTPADHRRPPRPRLHRQPKPSLSFRPRGLVPGPRSRNVACKLQAKLVQPPADRALVHLDPEPVGNLSAQVNAAPPHHLIPLRVGLDHHQSQAAKVAMTRPPLAERSSRTPSGLTA